MLLRRGSKKHYTFLAHEPCTLFFLNKLSACYAWFMGCDGPNRLMQWEVSQTTTSDNFDHFNFFIMYWHRILYRPLALRLHRNVINAAGIKHASFRSAAEHRSHWAIAAAKMVWYMNNVRYIEPSHKQGQWAAHIPNVSSIISRTSSTLSLDTVYACAMLMGCNIKTHFHVLWVTEHFYRTSRYNNCTCSFFIERPCGTRAVVSRRQFSCARSCAMRDKLPKFKVLPV